MAEPEPSKEITPLKPLAEVSPEEVAKAISSTRIAAPGGWQPAFRMVREFGREAQPPMTEPRAVAVRPDGWIIALDRPAQDQFRLLGCAPAGKTGSVDVRLSTGEDDEAVLDPAGLAVDGEQNFYVADAEANCVKKFSPDGRWLASFTSAGFDGSPLHGPRDVAVDDAGNVCLADTFNNRVVKLRPDGELEWALERFTPAAGGAEDELYEPFSVCLRGDRIVVGDTNNNRILVFDAKRRLRNVLSKGFVFPSGVRLSRDGKSVYVADHGNQRFRRFGADGKSVELTLAARLDSNVAVAGGSAMDVDAEGHVVLVHPLRGSIVVLDFQNGTP